MDLEGVEHVGAEAAVKEDEDAEADVREEEPHRRLAHASKYPRISAPALPPSPPLTF